LSADIRFTLDPRGLTSDPAKDRLSPAKSVRGSARSTQVERALRVRFRLQIENGDAEVIAS
jgi:hypothetical protein